MHAYGLALDKHLLFTPMNDATGHTGYSSKFGEGFVGSANI